MSSIILQAETLNLPESFAVKFRGKKIELIENEDTVIIKPIQSVIDEAYGMFKNSNFGTNALLEQKRIEKELEYGE